MKKLIIALFAFASISAFADAKVGDMAAFDLTVSGMGTGTTISTITAFDPATQTYTVKTETNFNGQTEVEEEASPAADMATDAQIAAVLANCANYGGTAENITVPAGTFAVCTMNGMSIGNVPFGVVKLVQMSEGMTITMELSSMARGN